MWEGIARALTWLWDFSAEGNNAARIVALSTLGLLIVGVLGLLMRLMRQKKPTRSNQIAASNASGVQSIGTGHSVGDITINHGLTADDLMRLCEWYASEERDKREKAEEILGEVAQKLAITEKAILGFLKEFGQANVPREQWPQKLQELSEQFKVVASKASNMPDVHFAIERGQFGRAQTAARQGEVAVLRLRYQEAAAFFAEAAELAPGDDSAQRLGYIHKQADVLYRQGVEFGDNDALKQCIQLRQEILTMTPRQKGPLAWAMAQNNLANALQTLGERESGTKSLEAAVTAYEEALKEYR